MREVRTSACVLAGLLLTVPAATGAQEGSPPDAAEAPVDPVDPVEREAVAAFEAGERAYFAGDYERAIYHLKRAIDLRPTPVLLYNLARPYERADRLEEAIDAYRAYLAAKPDAGDREEIQRRIDSLERERVERAASEARSGGSTEPVARVPPPASEPRVEPEPDVAEPTTAKRSQGGAGAMPWIVAGIGLVGVGAGVALWFVADAKHATAADEPVQRTAHGLQSEAEDLAMAGNVTLAAGGVVMLAGIIWGVTDDAGRGTSDASAAIRLHGSGRTVGIQGVLW